MYFMQVIWKRLYSCSSGMDAGTMFQLRNLINRRNDTKDPTSNVSACEDFFVHVVEVHIISAFMTAFQMSSLDDTPSTDIFSADSAESDSSTRRRFFLDAIQNVLDDHIDISIDGEGNSDEARDDDHVLSYARDVLTLGLLYMEFQDAIRGRWGASFTMLEILAPDIQSVTPHQLRLHPACTISLYI